MILFPKLSRQIRHTFIFLCLMISGLAIQSLYAAPVQSIKTGNWNDVTVWSNGAIPGAADNVTIISPHIVSMNASGAIANLTINSGATLQFNDATTSFMLSFDAASVITVNGTLTMGQLGVLQTGATGTVTLTMASAGTLKTSNVNGMGPDAGASFQTQGTGVFDLTSLNTAGTVNYVGVGTTAYIITDRNYNNLTLNNGGNATWTLAADRTIAGTLLSTSTSLTYVGTQNIFVGGNLNSQTTLNPGTSTYVLNGTAAQFINHNGTPFNNFVINKSAGVVTTFFASTFNGNFTVTAGTFTPTHAFTIKGTFTNNATATGLSGWNFGGDFVNNGTFSTGAAATTFNGTAPQSIGGTSTSTFTSLTISNAAGVTLNQSATVSTALGLSAGVFTLTSPLTLGNGATITRSGLGSFSGTPVFGTTVNLTYSNTAASPAITPGAELPASSTVLNNFIVSNFSFNTTVNLASDITVNGALTLSGALAFLNAGVQNINIKGTWTNSASTTAFTAGTGTVTWNGAAASIAGTSATTFNNVTVSIGANTMTISTAPTVNGVFTLTSGTVALGTIGFIAKGNVINNSSAAPFTGTTGVFQFAGTAPQSLTGSFATTFTRLTMNNPAGLTLGTNATVTLALTLTSGTISTGANSLALSTGTTTVTRTNGYVIGNFTKAFATGSNVTKIFEIGTGADYTPVNLTFPSITTAGSLTATTVGVDHPDVANSGLDATKDVNRYWAITNSGLVFNNYSAAFTFVSADIDPGSDFNTFEVRKLNTPNWTYTTTGTRTATSTQATALTTFSDFAVGTVIPVTPEAPVLVSPANGTVNLIITPTLTWNSVYGATTYGVTVATDPGFTNIVINQSGLATPSYTVVTPLNNSTLYYWHATATNVAGTSLPSSDWSFTTIIAIPPAPVLTAPVDAATEVSTTPLLTWDPATGAATYRVQISSDPGFATLIIDQAGIGTNSYTVSPPLGTSSLYYWRVNATNVGGTGPYSTASSFTTLLIAPAVPTLLSPTNLATNISIIPTLSWNSVLGATSYSAQVATDAGFTNVVASQTGITGTSFNISVPLASGTVHYWHVSSTNIGGTSDYSGAWSFTTRTPATITSTKTGNWNDPTVWSTGYVPSLGDAVVIATGHTVTMDANATITSLTVTGTLQFTNTTTAFTLTFASASVITVNGTLTMGQLGVLQTGATGTVTLTMASAGTLKTSNVNGMGPDAGASFQTQGTGVFDLTSLNTAGTVNYVGVGTTAYIITDRNYNNLTLNNGGNATWTLAADRTIAGTLLSTSTSLTYVGTQNIFVGGNLNSQTTLNPGTSTYVLNGTAAQFINHNGTPFNNFVINKSAGVVTTFFASTFNGNFTVTAGTFTPTHAFTIKGTFTNNATATGLSGWNFGGDFVNNGTFSTGAAATTFNGTAPQSIGGTSTSTFTSLTISNAAGVTLNQSATVSTALGLSAGVFTLTSPLTLGNGATITRSGLGSFSGTPVFGTTVNLTYSNTAASPAITPGAELPASSTVLNNFIVSNFSFNTTVNLASDITVNGALTLSGALAFLNAGVQNINIKGTWTNSASTTAFTAGTGTVTWNGAAASIAGTSATTFNNVTVSIGANTMTISTAPTVNGVFTLTSGTVALGTIGFIAKGNVINNSSAAPFTGTTGVFQFAGTAPQSLTGSFATTFTRLTMNNPAGLTLGTNATVTLALTLTSGTISTGANSLALSTGTTTVTRTNGYVIGNFTKAFATGSNVTKIFEIGTGADYTPVNLTFPSITTAGSLTATTVGVDHSNIATSGLAVNGTVNRYWTLTNSGLVFTNYSAVFNFVATDIDPGANTTIFLVKQYADAVWSSPTTGTKTTTSTQATGLTAMGDFVVGQETSPIPPVPVLISPTNNATGVVRLATFSWNASTGADSYRLQVSTDPVFATTDIDQSGILLTNFTLTTELAYNTTYYWRVNAGSTGGSSDWSTVWTLTTLPAVFNISLSSGWNLISSYVAANSPVLETLMSGVAANLVIMKNNAGQVYWPAFGVNSIGSWNSGEGYQVYMSAADALAVQGSMIAPESNTISLALGWNVAAYSRYTSQAAETALAGIVGNLVIVKNNLGQVYWPVFSVNTIGNLMPGEGYQMYLSAASSLTYPANDGPMPKAITAGRKVVPPCRHYTNSASVTGSNAILLANSTDIVDGDEVGVWTKEQKLVGAGVGSGGKILLTIWGDDDMTSNEAEGAKPGEELFLKWWSVNDKTENAMGVLSLIDGLTGQVLDAKLQFQHDALWVAQLEKIIELPTHFQLAQNFPNPFNPSTTIKYGLPKDVAVRLELYNMLGQRQAVLVDEVQKAGYYQLEYRNSELGSGVYFLSLQAGDFSEMKKMTILK